MVRVELGKFVLHLSVGFYIPDGVRKSWSVIYKMEIGLCCIIPFDNFRLSLSIFPSPIRSGVLSCLHGFFVLGHVESCCVPQHD